MKSYQVKVHTILILILSLSLVYSGCQKSDTDDTFQPNIFTVDDDIALGQQLHEEIMADPQSYPVLNKSQYSTAYSHITRIRDSVLSSGKVAYDNTFPWDVYIIKNDTVLNAFATPGGYMYFYTGLIKYLDNEAQFAGVMGHEMAHAARRHSTNQLTKVYGLQILISLALGQNPALLAQMAADIAAGLAVLAFSRDHEYESDEYSVKYLYETSYDARGVAGFFEKLEGSPRPPEFLSTHPNPENRVDKIMEVFESLGGQPGIVYEASYAGFKSSLP